MKRTLTVLLILLAVAVIGGGLLTHYCRPEEIVKLELLLPDTTPSPTESPAPTLTPTPSAALTPSPEPTVDADWYREREKTLRRLLVRNGSYQNSDEVDAAIEAMGIDPDRPMVALTFDDGPVPGVTDKILDILERYHVRATFFVLGVRLKKPEAVALVQRAVSLGCEIGDHTWNHKIMTNISISEMRWSIVNTNRIIYDNTGYDVRLLRPPGGYSNGNVRRIAKEQNMAVVLWAQSGNVHEQDPEKIAENVQKQIVNGKELEDGDIILLHDTKERMIRAVEIMVPQLLDEGYQLVTVSELINLSEDGFVPGKTYRKQES